MTEPLGEFWLYPLDKGDLLSSNEWVEWHGHAFLGSSFVAHAIAENQKAAAFDAILLWTESYRQNPAGTLPDDDVQLARLAGYGADIAGWRAARPFALQGWRVTHVQDGGEGFTCLGHPFIAEIAARSYKRKKGRLQAREGAAAHVARSRVKAKLRALGNTRAAEHAPTVEAVLLRLTERQLAISDDHVRAVFAEVSGEGGNVAPFPKGGPRG